jgi:hypothetical protein
MQLCHGLTVLTHGGHVMATIVRYWIPLGYQRWQVSVHIDKQVLQPRMLT